MSHRRLIRYGGPIVLLVVLVVTGVILMGASQSTPTASTGTPATEEQRQEFVALIQWYRRVYFNGWVTGDLSSFPTVFYNDSGEQLIAHMQTLIDAHRSAVNMALSKTASGPVGVSEGLLSGEMAQVLDWRESDAHWQQAEATAHGQGREATLADMPGGQPPVTTPSLSDWVDKQVFITEALVQGDVASVTYVVDSPDSTLLFHLHLRHVGEQWYITNYWVTGSP